LKAPAFAYVRAETLEHVHEVLARFGAEAKLLAGGQSLVPALNMRLAAPAVLIDINTLSELNRIEERTDGLRIGALTRHASLEHSALVAEHLPAIAQAMPHVAHVAIRNRGTLGGSLAFADPNAELPACCLALGASMIASSVRGERRIAAEAFFVDLYETALAPDEILIAVEFPRRPARERQIFMELARRHGDYATGGLALAVQMTDGVVAGMQAAFLGAHRTPKLAQRAARCLVGQALGADALETAREALREDLDPLADIYHTAATKLHLAGVLFERALDRLSATPD